MSRLLRSWIGKRCTVHGRSPWTASRFGQETQVQAVAEQGKTRANLGANLGAKKKNNRNDNHNNKKNKEAETEEEKATGKEPEKENGE